MILKSPDSAAQWRAVLFHISVTHRSIPSSSSRSAAIFLIRCGPTNNLLDNTLEAFEESEHAYSKRIFFLQETVCEEYT